METRLPQARKLKDEFLERWSLKNIEEMNLKDYVDVDNPDTFCQWLETKTKPLGSIKGYPSSKFGIYKRKNPKEIPENFISDKEYSWLNRYGKSRKDAFIKIKQDILKIIKAAQENNFSEIDKIHFHIWVKWKIAFLYCNESFIPIYKSDILIEIAESFGLLNSKRDQFSIFHKIIFENKPFDKNVYQFADELLDKFSGEDSYETSYYILGTKYGEHSNEDVFPLMENQSVVSTGFLWDEELSYLYQENQSDIVRVLKEKGEKSKSYSALKYFLNLKVGDVIALKSFGGPKAGKPYLEIIAYAVVVEQDEKVYWYDPINLGHCINVRFIDTNIKREYSIGGYGRTIHKITDEELINTIFKDYKNPRIKKVRKKIKNKRRLRKPQEKVNTKGQKRKGTDPYVTNPKHNRIQELFADYLKEVYTPEDVLLEDNNVDIKLLQPDYIKLYEVKPYDFAEDCIRAGIGQLLSYTHFDNDKRTKQIRIVGPNPPDDEEKMLISFLKSTLNIDFDYINFEIT